MKLILMTTPDFFVEEHQILTALFEEGLEILHLRKPHTEPVYSERLLTLIPESYRKHIVVHDHFYLKEEYGLMGIHLNKRNPDLPKSYKGHISCSCHTVDEAKSCKKFCNYVLYNPLLNESDEGQDITQLKRAVDRLSDTGIIDKKLVALGGVDAENIPIFRNYGFGGAVVMGDIWNRFNIHSTQDYKDVINHFRKLKKLAE